MQRLEKFDSTLLSALQVLLVAGLGSRHRSIVGQSITMWNSTFGRTERLEYPDTLLKALIRVRALSDILLPGLLPEYESVEVSRVSDLTLHTLTFSGAGYTFSICRYASGHAIISSLVYGSRCSRTARSEV
jgi:hypothetical protein